MKFKHNSETAKVAVDYLMDILDYYCDEKAKRRLEHMQSYVFLQNLKRQIDDFEKDYFGCIFLSEIQDTDTSFDFIIDGILLTGKIHEMLDRYGDLKLLKISIDDETGKYRLVVEKRKLEED